MTKPVDPKRLVDEGGTPARVSEAIRLARRGPDTDSMARISGALGLAPPLAPPPVPPPSGLAVATGGGGALSVAGIAAVVVVTGIGAGALVLSRPASKATPPVAQPAAQVASAVEIATPASQAPAPVVAEPERAAAATPSTRRRKLEHEVTTPEAAPSAEVEPPAPAAPPADAASRLREEAMVVRDAERLLGSNPARALALTEERRQRFPGGALGQEAEVVAIEALLKLGRREAALARARSFEASHPGSVHARRLHALIGSNP